MNIRSMDMQLCVQEEQRAAIAQHTICTYGNIEEGSSTFFQVYAHLELLRRVMVHAGCDANSEALKRGDGRFFLRLPRMALRCPSSVWRTVLLISCSFFPRNCSEAVWRRSAFFMILTCATPVTVRGTPWAVSTLSQTGFRVIT